MEQSTTCMAFIRGCIMAHIIYVEQIFVNIAVDDDVGGGDGNGGEWPGKKYKR